VNLATALPPVNPVLARELKQRMRGRHTWLVLTIYLTLLAVILRWVYVAASRDSSVGGVNVFGSASVGRAIFQWLLFFMLLLVCFIVPGLTAAAISGERERQTLISLQLSLLRPRSIVVGKLLASLAFVVLLIVASLPLVTIPFLVGGVTASEVVRGLVMVLATALLLACLALACSAVLRRTQAATVLAYGLTLALVLGTLVVYGAQQVPRSQGSPRPAPWVLALNPFTATADVVQGRNPSEGFESPFRPLAGLLRLTADDRVRDVLTDGPTGFSGDNVVVRPVTGGIRVVPSVNGPAPPTIIGGPVPFSVGGSDVVSSNGFASNPDTTSSPQEDVRLGGAPFWLLSLAAWGLLGAAALALAIHRISLPAARESG
jgi:ABC-type transport system involved in multi-copper enzyme maturation permease subunit